MRRVVITGIGAVTPLGTGVEATWKAILSGKSGSNTITKFDSAGFATTYACEIEYGDGSNGTFNPDNFLEKKEQRKVDPFIMYGIAAANEAISDSGWSAIDREAKNRTGVIIGSGIGGLGTIFETAILLKEKGPRRISPFFIPGSLVNLVSGQVSIEHGFMGPNHAVSTACATGAHAIGDAARLIIFGDADVMVAGGSESPITEIGIAGFNACRALSTRYSETPETASRPFDEDRDGFVMGEGSGVVVLEELSHALERGANIYAEVLGYGLTGDAHHITAPSQDGDGGYRAMKAALNNANLLASELDYINAHGTSTAADLIELSAVERLFSNPTSNLTLSSTKSATGHLLGAAGSIEAIFAILSIRDQVVPPTINLQNPSTASWINLVPNKKKNHKVKYAMSNSFGFGGTNAALIFGKLDV